MQKLSKEIRRKPRTSLRPIPSNVSRLQRLLLGKFSLAADFSGSSQLRPSGSPSQRQSCSASRFRAAHGSCPFHGNLLHARQQAAMAQLTAHSSLMIFTSSVHGSHLSADSS